MTNTCNETFELFGDQWNLRIIDSIHLENRRFTEIQRLTTINTATLTKTKISRKSSVCWIVFKNTRQTVGSLPSDRIGARATTHHQKMRHFSSQLDVSAKVVWKNIGLNHLVGYTCQQVGGFCVYHRFGSVLFKRVFGSWCNSHSMADNDVWHVSLRRTCCFGIYYGLPAKPVNRVNSGIPYSHFFRSAVKCPCQKR